MAICGYIEGKFLHFPLPVLPVCFAAGNRQRPLKPLPPAKALPVACIFLPNQFILRYDFYEKAVTFRPYQVDMLDPVTANFLGDNLRCWMQIQVGKGPQASEVSGIVKIGQTMTMVLGVKDDENKFDMIVRSL